MSKKSAPFRLNPVTRAARALAVLASLASPGLALADDPPPAGLEFSQSPPISSSTASVAPNIILSIDDSGSMSQAKDVKDATGANVARIEALKSALKSTFSKPAYLNKFRLGWQAMWNNRGFGPNRFFVKPTDPDNRLRWFDTAEQTDFMKWVNTLTGTGDRNPNGFYSTPSHLLAIYAGEYFKGRELAASNTFANTKRLDFTPVSSINNPWNMKPGVATDSKPLSCRRAYHIFMSDGLWNLDQSAAGSNVTRIFMPYVSSVSGASPSTDANYDGNSHLLGDGATYDPSTLTIPIYSDGSPTTYGNVPYYTYNMTGTPTGGNICGYQPYITPVTDTSPGAGLGCSSSLADFALYYWGTNLSGNDLGNVPKWTVTDPETVIYASPPKMVTYDKYWNPKNDPATWQHMQTYTIGYGTQNDPDNPGAGVISGSGNLPAFDGFYDGNFYRKFASGAVAWPNTGANFSPANLYDLVHAAYNGRGKFYTATTQTALQDAFEDILNNAINQNFLPSLSSVAGSSTQLNGHSMVYAAGYAYNNDSSSATTDNKLGGWSGWIVGFASDKLDSPPPWAASVPDAASRNIFTADASGKGVVFTTIEAVRKIKPPGDIVNSQLVYVGKPTLLSLDANYITFSKTVNAFNGSPPNQYRQGVVYVGANDGMLHGFDAGNGSPGNYGTGNELFAYVPRGLLKKLEDTTFGPDYQHRYWVDSGMFSGDAQLDSGSYGIGTDSGSNPGHWATVLAGTLGAGGKGYFVLDVTQPDLIKESHPDDALAKAVLIDATDPDTTLAGQTVASGEPSAVGKEVSAYIGHQFSQPVLDMYNLTFQSSQIVRINSKTEGEWAVIMGNGYNNASGVPVLLIQSLSQKTGAVPTLYTVAAKCTSTAEDCLAKGNGLSAPRPVDVDGNGTADFVYAGDLMGNLWKFDISNVEDRSKWGVAYNGEPMFTAVGPTGKAQPITSAPVVVPNKNGGFMVAFGTGQNLTQEDTVDAPNSANAPLNSFYALYDVEKMSVEPITIKAASGSDPEVRASQVKLDETTLSMSCKATGTARYASCLYERKGGILSTTVGIVSHGKTDDTNLAGKIDGTTKLGWYYDIPETDNGNAAKVLANPMMVSDTVALFLADNVASSNSSAGESNSTESCDTVNESNRTQTTINFFDLFTGAPPPDNSITITIGGVTSPTGNRIRFQGGTKIVRDGTDGLVIIHGGSGGKPDPSPADPYRVDHKANDSAGRRAGWRFGR